MNAEEFYNHVSSWSRHRRHLESIIHRCTEAKFAIVNKERRNEQPTDDELQAVEKLNAEQAKMDFIVRGLVATIDAEVDRVEIILQNKRETAQISNE